MRCSGTCLSENVEEHQPGVLGVNRMVTMFVSEFHEFQGDWSPYKFITSTVTTSSLNTSYGEYQETRPNK